MSYVFRTFEEAYLAGLERLLTTGTAVPSVTDRLSIASNFGKGDRPAVEILGYQFEISNPGLCLVASSARRFNIPYFIGLLLWTLSGSDSAEWLAYYDGNAKVFSSDGLYLCGAFGKRLFGIDRQGQLGTILKRLSDDPASRRAVGVILDPQDNARQLPDYPCAIAVQYFIRDGELSCIVYMRAQQALTVLPFDCFVFIGLQQYLASRLGLKCGRYIHFSGTFHIYESERKIAQQVIENGVRATHLGPLPTTDGELDTLLMFERELRQAAVCGNREEIVRFEAAQISAGSFVQHAKLVLLLHAWDKLGEQRPQLLNSDGLSQELRAILLEHSGEAGSHA